MRPVPGGGKMRPNSAAREVRGVCVCEERAKSMLTFCERRERIVWGVMSFASAICETTLICVLSGMRNTYFLL